MPIIFGPGFLQNEWGFHRKSIQQTSVHRAAEPRIPPDSASHSVVYSTSAKRSSSCCVPLLRVVIEIVTVTLQRQQLYKDFRPSFIQTN